MAGAVQELSVLQYILITGGQPIDLPSGPRPSIDALKDGFREVIVPAVEGLTTALRKYGDTDAQNKARLLGEAANGISLVLSYNDYKEVGLTRTGAVLLSGAEAYLSSVTAAAVSGATGNPLAGFAAGQAVGSAYQDIAKARLEASRAASNEKFLAGTFNLLPDQNPTMSANSEIQPGGTGDPLRDRYELGLTTNQLRDNIYGGSYTNTAAAPLGLNGYAPSGLDSPSEYIRSATNANSLQTPAAQTWGYVTMAGSFSGGAETMYINRLLYDSSGNSVYGKDVYTGPALSDSLSAALIAADRNGQVVPGSNTGSGSNGGTVISVGSGGLHGGGVSSSSNSNSGPSIVGPGGGLHEPILLDLDGEDGVEITELSRSNIFMDGDDDGLSACTAWAGVGDGVLFVDVDGDNEISSAREYVFTHWAPDAASDLEALRRRFDTNGDGKLTAADADFADFKVMVTKADGTLEAKTLAQLNITQLNLKGNAHTQSFADGSAILAEASFLREDGSTGTLADTQLAAEHGGHRLVTTVATPTTGTRITTTKAYDTSGKLASTLVHEVQSNGNSIIQKLDANGDGVVDQVQTILRLVANDNFVTLITEAYLASSKRTMRSPN